MNDRYFDWLVDLVNADDFLRLCTIMDGLDFTYILPLDENRIDDAFELRDIYTDETGDDHGRNFTSCSLFEMIVAMAVRCDRDIMYEASIGHRYSLWFHCFVENLFEGKARRAEQYMTEEEVIDICSRFMNRDYERDGTGGMFPVKHDRRDQRRVQIWLQMNIWLVENVKEIVL